MDRFALRLSLGYVPAEQEIAILTAQAMQHPLERLESCATVQDVLALRAASRRVAVSDEIKRYIVDLVRATRAASQVQLGAGPRASLALVAIARHWPSPMTRPSCGPSMCAMWRSPCWRIAWC